MVFTVIPFFSSDAQEINQALLKSFTSFNAAEYYLQQIKLSHGVQNAEIIENELVWFTRDNK